MSTPINRLLVTVAAAAAVSAGVFAQPEIVSIDPEAQLLEQIAEFRAKRD